MAYITTNYQIAAGNNNAAGLTAITDLADGDSNTFVEPLALPNISRGLRQVRANGVATRSGFPQVVWVSDMLYSQYLYLVDNYEGLVTVKLAYMSLTWANYNAVLELPDPNELEYVIFAASDHQLNWDGPGFRGVRWTFRRIVAI